MSPPRPKSLRCHRREPGLNAAALTGTFPAKASLLRTPFRGSGQRQPARGHRQDANSCRIRTELRLPAADSHAAGPEYPSLTPRRLADRPSPDLQPRRSRLATMSTASAMSAHASSPRPAARRSRPLFEIYDQGLPDVVAPEARQHDIRDLPDDVLVFLLGSRYCDTDRLGDFAWAQFGKHRARLGARPVHRRLRARSYRV